MEKVKTTTNTKQRVQFDFTPEALKRLDNIQALIEASTRAEVVRNALKMYEWMLTQIDPESTLEVQDKEGHVQFRIPAKVLLS